ncbi:MAG: MarR family transcriptional regulator [Bacteroidetes bacterium]|nr:MarR family transcriptional regulator [Bacteroidota bacterium]
MITANDQKIAHNLRNMVSRLNRSLRKQVGYNEQLSIAEENVLRVLLAQEEAFPSGLCAQLDLSSQFISQVLNRLEKLGYISRKPSKTDKRKSIVTLSKDTMQRFEQRRKQKEDWLASLISKKYTKQQKEQIAQAIELLAQIQDDK